MPAREPLYRLIGVTISKLSKEEIILLEAELFARICEELKETFRKQFRDYFYLMKYTIEKENRMLDSNFMCLIIKDILSTGEYDLKGIAYYTDTFEDVIEEVILGLNLSPSAKFFQKLIDLHRLVRRDLYSLIIKKIAKQYSAVA